MISKFLRQVRREGRGELAPSEVKVPRQRISNWVGRPGEVVVARDVAVEALVDAEKAKQVCRDFLRRRAPLALPEEGVEVVRLAEDGAFADVERLGDCLEVQERARQLEVRV